VNELQAWLKGRLPEDWFDGEPEVSVDREEIVIVGRLASPTGSAAEGADDASTGDAARSAEHGRISRFREETRPARMHIADEAETRFGRKVSWGAACGESRVVFTNLSVPVMTRLRQSERQVLDTLVEAGVARSRSDALAWCVRLVGRHEGDWIARLKDSLEAVREARAAGPAA
jgi:hypothetical protein